MKNLGHEVEIISLDSPDNIWVDSFPLPLVTIGKGWGKYGYNHDLVPWLRKYASRYDAIIVQGIWQYHSFGVWRALAKSKIPYFVFTHGMLSPWFKRKYPLKHLKKWLYWPWAEYRVLRDAKCVLFTTEEERILAGKSFWLYQCHERVVGYGTKVPPGETEEQIKAFYLKNTSLRGKPFFLFLGRMHPVKGCDLLIEAFAQIAESHSDWHLVMAGPDQINWQKQLVNRCEKLKISDRVHWMGVLRGKIKWGAMKAAKAFVLPSHQENFGIVVAEALACGRPVLITDRVNIWREVKESQAGLVGSDDLTGVKKILHQFIALSEESRTSMEKAATKCYTKHFDVEKTTIGMLEVIKEELSSQ